jgi:putative transposase
VAAHKKKAVRLGAHLVFADESGFLLIPNLAKTWAPVGETPVMEHPYKRDKISLISGVSVSPQRQRLGLYYLLFYDNIGQEEVVLFLRELLRHLRGQVMVLLDNSTIHKGEPIEQLRCQHPRLHIEYFPSYAPELNPDEGVWCQSKKSLANGCSKDVEELTEDVMRAVDAIKNSPEKLRACIDASELAFFLR